MHRPPAPTVRYVDQVVGDGSPSLQFRFGGIRVLSWRQTDVVHLHRLNPLLGPRVSGPKRVLMMAAVAVLLKRHRIALVRTVHGPRSPGLIAALSNWFLDRATTSFVVLDGATSVPRGRPVTVIPYGHYRDRFLGYPRAEQVPDRVFCIAPVTPGRDLEGPLQDFTTPSGIPLRVAGEASTELSGLTGQVAVATESGKRAERVSDGALVTEMSAAGLVVVPRVAELEDLSLLLLALSLDRPVLVPDTESTRQLADEVGSAWVHRYPGELTTAALDAATQALRTNPPTGRPNLDGRDPGDTSARYAELFRAAAAKAGRKR